jgi:hypothetical protein
LARSKRKGLSRQIGHATVAKASDVCDDEEVRKRGRSIRTQLSSFSHLDRSDDQMSMFKGLVAIAKSSGAWKARSSKAKIVVVVLRSVHCHMWVFSCGEAEPGDPLGGAMQCGGGGGAKRRTMRAQQVRECWEGEGRRRETVGGGSCPFIELSSGGRPVHAPSPIRRAPNPGGTTPRPRL